LDKGIPAKREDERVENRQRLAVGVRGVVQGVGLRRRRAWLDSSGTIPTA
jgi:hypothetical protein